MQWFHRRSTKCGRGRRRRMNSARISHPPPFRRVTKNKGEGCACVVVPLYVEVRACDDSRGIVYVVAG